MRIVCSCFHLLRERAEDFQYPWFEGKCDLLRTINGHTQHQETVTVFSRQLDICQKTNVDTFSLITRKGHEAYKLTIYTLEKRKKRIELGFVLFFSPK